MLKSLSIAILSVACSSVPVEHNIDNVLTDDEVASMLCDVVARCPSEVHLDTSPERLTSTCISDEGFASLVKSLGEQTPANHEAYVQEIVREQRACPLAPQCPVGLSREQDGGCIRCDPEQALSDFEATHACADYVFNGSTNEQPCGFWTCH